MIIVRLLDSDADRDLLTEAWHFRDAAPRWFRECMDIFKESFEEYMEASRNELHFGVFEDGQLVAVVRMIPERPTVWNLHLLVRRGTSIETLFAAGLDVKRRMLEHGASFYGYIYHRNQAICRLYESLGFIDSGLRIYKGQIRGKVVEWIHYTLLNPSV